MKIKTNKLSSVKQYFNEELALLYPATEIDTFFKWSTEHLLDYKSADFVTRSEEALSESMLLKFIKIVKQLKEQKPIQYILGETYFYGLKFNVDADVLIPRPETEELVDWIKKDLVKNTIVREGFGLNILDIGTGSGCIAITLKSLFPQAHVCAVDTSRAALNKAQKNAELNKVNIEFVCADITHDYSSGLNYHIIVSNPPYVLKSESKQMNKNVLDFEPHLALFVPDNDPLLFYRAILKFAQRNLTDEGTVYFEINEQYGTEMIQLFEQFNYRQIELREDLNGKARMIKGIKKTI